MDPLPVNPIHFKLLLFSKQNKDLLALLSICVTHRNSSLNQHENKTEKQTNNLKKTNSSADIEKHILAFNIKHKHIWLNLKEMLPLHSHFSHFLVPNYAAPLEAFPCYMAASFPKRNHGAGSINCTKWEQISCLNLINLEQALITALDRSLFWTHWASRPINTVSMQYSTEHSVTKEEVVSRHTGKTQHLQANSKRHKTSYAIKASKEIILTGVSLSLTWSPWAWDTYLQQIEPKLFQRAVSLLLSFRDPNCLSWVLDSLW